MQNLKSKGKSSYIENFIKDEEGDEDDISYEDRDTLFNDAVQIIIQDKKASASYLQRKLKIGYNRAARMMEDMEALGLVGAADGSKPREVLVTNWPS